MAEGNITVTVNARADDVQALVDEVERLRGLLAKVRAEIAGRTERDAFEDQGWGQ